MLTASVVPSRACGPALRRGSSRRALGRLRVAAASATAPPPTQDEAETANRGGAAGPLGWVRAAFTSATNTSARTVRRLLRDVVAPTNALEPQYGALTDEELRGTTARLRAELAAGATLDSLLPSAFAAVREAARRTLGLRHYDVQLMGGAVLHEGAVAEMRTGEGKTLVATLAAYLNCLPAAGVHVVTVNDYLAARDAAWMGKVYRALGASCGCVGSATPEALRGGEAGYGADVTYVTNSELGFDYLRDNMALRASDLRCARPFAFALVDEVDSVLIDEGRNPLLISSVEEAEEGGERYATAARCAEALRAEEHYTVDRKQRGAALTEAGMEAAEAFLGVADVWDGAEPWAKFVLNAVKAKELYLRDAQYIVRDGEVAIVDEFTGRVFASRRWTDNIHQAVEAKEGLPVQGEQVTAATITYQSFFKLYPKLAGMTGTARTEAEEFWRMYRLEVVTIPTHAPNVREDLPTSIFKTAEAKWAAVAEYIAEAHGAGVPVLVGTTSVEHSELLSALLAEHPWRAAAGGGWRFGVPHNLLNARAQYAAQEAAVVAQAGRSGAVTIATNMAGRGTDIVLGGSPVGLAREALAAALLPALGHAAPTPLAEGSAGPLAPSRAAAAALAAACAAAARAWVGEAGEGAPSAEAAAEAASAAVEWAAAPRGAREPAAARPGAEERPAWLREDEGAGAAAFAALCAAASLVLADARRACESDAARVRAAGGLQVIGTQLHESRRIDNQLRGRAGRQGDPGRTMFVLSLQDELLSVHCPEWALQPLWDVAGLPAEAPVASAMVDSQLASIQQRIERHYAGARRQVADYDEVLSSHRNSAYTLRRSLLADPPAQLRARIFRYLAALLDQAAARCGVRPDAPPGRWDAAGLLAEARDLTAGRAERAAADAGLPPAGPHQLLPGVTAEALHSALQTGAPLPLAHDMPPLDAHPALLAAAMAGVPWSVDGAEAAGAEAARCAAERRALGAAIARRVEEARPLPRGRHALQAALLRAYLLEHAEALWADRAARLEARGVAAAEVEEAERLWVLSALDGGWTRHIAAMAVLRNSCNLRAFGLLEPLEEYNVDGARAFDEFALAFRRAAVQSFFAFVDPIPADGGAADGEEA